MGELIIPDLSHQIYQIKGLISIRNFNSIIGINNVNFKIAKIAEESSDDDLMQLNIKVGEYITPGAD